LFADAASESIEEQQPRSKMEPNQSSISYHKKLLSRSVSSLPKLHGTKWPDQTIKDLLSGDYLAVEVDLWLNDCCSFLAYMAIVGLKPTYCPR
jgi:hypothetical protein